MSDGIFEGSSDWWLVELRAVVTRRLLLAGEINTSLATSGTGVACSADSTVGQARVQDTVAQEVSQQLSVSFFVSLFRLRV